MRHRLRELAGAWDLLDELPRTNVDETFAQTTVAMVAVAAAKDLDQLNAQAPRRAAKRRLWSVASFVIAAAIGFIALTWIWPDQNQQLLKELSVVENWPLYQQAGSLEFLRELDKQGTFAQVAAEETAQPSAAANDVFTLTSSRRPARVSGVAGREPAGRSAPQAPRVFAATPGRARPLPRIRPRLARRSGVTAAVRSFAILSRLAGCPLAAGNERTFGIGDRRACSANRANSQSAKWN